MVQLNDAYARAVAEARRDISEKLSEALLNPAQRATVAKLKEQDQKPAKPSKEK